MISKNKKRKKKKKEKRKKKEKKKRIPVQVIPFPEYPNLQVQEQLPGVLVHIAALSQLFAPEHSFIS